MHPRRTSWLLGGLAIAAGVGLVAASRTSAPRRRVVSGNRVLLLGDSLAVGLTAPLKQLAAGEGVDLRAHGVSGSRIANWDDAMLHGLLAPRPSLVLVSLGTNDMKMADPAVEQPLLDRLVAKLRASADDVILIDPPTMPFPDRGVRSMLASTGLAAFPSAALDIPRGPDQIHPTARGYSGWAAALWRWL